jgi:hypothetical protein
MGISCVYFSTLERPMPALRSPFGLGQGGNGTHARHAAYYQLLNPFSPFIL